MEEQKTQEINIDELVLKVASAIENKNQKNEKSIVDSNFSKLPDNEKEQAYKAWEEKKTADAQKITNKISNLEKSLKEANDIIARYKEQEKQAVIKDKSIAILKEIGIDDDNKIKIISDLSKSGLGNCYVDNDFDSEKAKEVLQETIKDYGIDTQKKQEEHPKIQIGTVKKDNKPTSQDDEYERILGIIK